MSTLPINTTVAYIPLTRGFQAVVDIADYDLVSQHTWHADVGQWTTYAKTNVVRPDGIRITIRMHQLLCGDGADHKDGDGLNNRRSNLRPSTDSQNSANQKKRVDAETSKYKGVYWSTKETKWVAQIQCDGKRKHLGYFQDEESAARAYDSAARKTWGEFARCNFTPSTVKARLCTECGETIPEKRLKAVPSAQQCVPCKEKLGDVPLLRRFDETSRQGTVETFFTEDSRVARQLSRQQHAVPGQHAEAVETDFTEETTPGLSLTDVIEDETAE